METLQLTFSWMELDTSRLWTSSRLIRCRRIMTHLQGASLSGSKADSSSAAVTMETTGWCWWGEECVCELTVTLVVGVSMTNPLGMLRLRDHLSAAAATHTQSIMGSVVLSRPAAAVTGVLKWGHVTKSILSDWFSPFVSFIFCVIYCIVKNVNNEHLYFYWTLLMDGWWTDG